MIDVKRIESFVLVMRCGSLAQAERKAGVPRATLSRQIAKLEETLDVQLFLRSAQRMVPTEAGRTYYAHCERLLAQVDAGLTAAQADVQNLAEGLRGDLTISTQAYLSTSFVSQVVGLYLERYPNVVCHLNLVGGELVTVADNIDCHVCTEPPDQSNLVGKLLGKVTYRLFASPDYLRRNGDPTTVRELEFHKGVMLVDAARGNPWRLRSGTGVDYYRPRVVLSSNDYWIVKTFAIDGCGIALLPDFFVRPELDSGALRPLLPDWHSDKIPVYCVYQKHRYMSRKLRAFVDLMAASFKQIDSFHRYVGKAPLAP